MLTRVDPLTLILTALVAGVSAGAKDTVSTVVSDAYAGLKALVLRRFKGRPAGELALEKLAENPDAWEPALKAECGYRHQDAGDEARGRDRERGRRVESEGDPGRNRRRSDRTGGDQQQGPARTLERGRCERSRRDDDRDGEDDLECGFCVHRPPS